MYRIRLKIYLNFNKEKEYSIKKMAGINIKNCMYLICYLAEYQKKAGHRGVYFQIIEIFASPRPFF